jgi:peptidoglycan/LPS O-acetylase OafA/YrhL
MEPIRPVYHSLNGLRGLAALIVVLFHAAQLIGRQLAPGGYLAVDLFFILSGFVIAHAYDHRFEEGLGPLAFIRYRIIRFYPLYLLGLAMGASWLALELIVSPPAALSGQQILIAFSLGLLFLPSPFGVYADLYPLNVPAWSLFFELVVNAAYAICYRLLTNRVLIVFTLFAGIILAAHMVLWGFATPVAGLLRAFFAFPLGVLIYRFKHRIPAMPVSPIVIVAALCLPMLIPVPEQARRFFDLASILLVFPVGIALGSKVDSPRLDPPAEWLGRISFPIYAIHYPVLQAGLGVKDHLPVPAPLIGAGLIVLLVLFCPLIDRYFDAPVRAWLSASVKRRFGRARQGSAAATR